jgi:hypothetical protein
MDSMFGRICRCCLQEATSLIPIFKKKGKSEIIEMISVIGGFKVCLLFFFELIIMVMFLDYWKCQGIHGNQRNQSLEV